MQKNHRLLNVNSDFLWYSQILLALLLFSSNIASPPKITNKTIEIQHAIHIIIRTVLLAELRPTRNDVITTNADPVIILEYKPSFLLVLTEPSYNAKNIAIIIQKKMV